MCGGSCQEATVISHIHHYGLIFACPEINAHGAVTAELRCHVMGVQYQQQLSVSLSK